MHILSFKFDFGMHLQTYGAKIVKSMYSVDLRKWFDGAGVGVLFVVAVIPVAAMAVGFVVAAALVLW